MAFPHLPGLLPAEIAFLCEMELVTTVPRQRLDRLDLLGGPTKPMIPPLKAQLPLWLAILLKRQKRVNILPPPWLNPDSLSDILEIETNHFQDSFSPALSVPPLKQTDADGNMFQVCTPFIATSTSEAPANALPYHWFEMSEILLNAASDDLVSSDEIRRFLRDIREVRLAKMRKGVDVLNGDGEGVQLNGVGAMELAESRGYITSVIDNLHQIGVSREQSRREHEEEERQRRPYGQDEDDDDDDADADMT